MRKLLVPAGLVASLVLATAAMAQTPATPAKPAAASTAVTKSTSPDADKQAACNKSWSAEKKHTGTKTAFMKACMSKG